MGDDNFQEELSNNLNPDSKVVRRTLMLKIDINTYPNGDWYINQSSSKMWIVGTKEQVKKKFKPKKKQIQQTIVNEDEVY